MTEIAERLHDAATAAGPDREILYDDRDESPGVKFTDAELLGMPWILTVSPRSLAAGGVEVTNRATGESRSGRSTTSRRSSTGRRGAGLTAGAGRLTRRARPSCVPDDDLYARLEVASTRPRRRSSSRGGRSSSATTRTSRARTSPRSTSRSGSTSRTTG